MLAYAGKINGPPHHDDDDDDPKINKEIFDNSVATHPSSYAKSFYGQLARISLNSTHCTSYITIGMPKLSRPSLDWKAPF